jgi:hypothetical protein
MPGDPSARGHCRFPDANDFGNEVIPGAKDAGMKVQAYAFKVRVNRVDGLSL